MVNGQLLLDIQRIWLSAVRADGGLVKRLERGKGSLFAFTSASPVETKIHHSALAVVCEYLDFMHPYCLHSGCCTFTGKGILSLLETCNVFTN
jgi:hypothetical protein